MTDIASLKVNVVNNDPLYSPAAPSPEFLIVDEESASTYPLLTPSPSIRHGFQHPLALESNQVLAYDRQVSPNSIDTDLSSLPAIGAVISPTEYTALNAATAAADTTTLGKEGVLQCHALTTRNSLQSGMESSSSSSSVLQETTAASAQLLNSHHYHNLAGDVTCQENGGIKPTLCGIQLTLRKSPQDFYFVSWNWPLIRKFCFWGVMSMMVACICVVIAYVTTLPTRCDPSRSWYQGSLIYEIFPGSFKDSDDDGIGDLNGIISKIDYLNNLGVQSIRLNSIFPSDHYPEHFYNVDNLTRIEETLGTIEDFRLLIKRLHNRNMSLILDIPLHPYFKELNPDNALRKSKLNLDAEKQFRNPDFSGNDNKVMHIIVNNHILNGNVNRSTVQPEPVQTKHLWNDDRSTITQILAYWLYENVDGFYMKNLENYISDENFSDQIVEWKNLLNLFDQTDGFDKILICSNKVVMGLEKYNKDVDNNPKLLTVLTHFNLIDVYIDDTKSIPKILSNVQNGILLSSPTSPWPLWTSGSFDTSRLATRMASANETLAAIVLLMMLPGTPSIFYGDEIGLDNIHDPNGERSDIVHVHSLAPMVWSKADERKGFTHSRMLPWVPEAKVHGPALGPKAISILSNVRENNPSIYMHAIWKDRQLNTNSAIRYVNDDLILLERTYPRRNTFVVVANIGSKRVTKDLSSIFYGGLVVLDHNGNSGQFVLFNKIELSQGEFYVLKLDK